MKRTNETKNRKNVFDNVAFNAITGVLTGGVMPMTVSGIKLAMAQHNKRKMKQVDAYVDIENETTFVCGYDFDENGNVIAVCEKVKG